MIEIEPLQERGAWWRAVLNNYGFEPDGTHRQPKEQAASERSVERWRELIRWFDKHDELHGASYIAIGEEPLSQTNFGCVFPRLHVALTHAGSLAGVLRTGSAHLAGDVTEVAQKAGRRQRPRVLPLPREDNKDTSRTAPREGEEGTGLPQSAQSSQRDVPDAVNQALFAEVEQ